MYLGFQVFEDFRIQGFAYSGFRVFGLLRIWNFGYMEFRVFGVWVFVVSDILGLNVFWDSRI